ncbi:MAG: hypothetical protein ACR2JB_16120 [Bryobacteraceae bacterium]
MEPLTTTIVTALALGASAGLKDDAKQVIKDGYSALREQIHRKFGTVGIAQLEQAPVSKARRAAVEQNLAATGAEHDPEVLKRAKEILEAIQQYAPKAAREIGVHLKDIRGASLNISRVLASHTGIEIEGADFSGDISISDIQIGQTNAFPKV